MSGSKRFTVNLTRFVTPEGVFVAIAAFCVGACAQPVAGDGIDDTVHTHEAVLDSDGVRVGRTRDGENSLGGTTIMRGQLEEGPHPDPWNEGPHPDPWAGSSSGGSEGDTGSSGTSGGTGGTAGSSGGSSSGTGPKNGS